METPTAKVCLHCQLPPVLPEVCTPEIHAVIEASIARDTALHHDGFELGKRMAGDAHPTPPPTAMAPERELRDRIGRVLADEATTLLRYADEERNNPYERHAHLKARHIVQMLAERIDALFTAPPPARAEAPEGEREPYSEDLTAFVIGAFNEGWAAHESGEFSTLEDAYNESHVKLQLGIGDPHACDCRAEVSRLTEALEQAQDRLGTSEGLVELLRHRADQQAGALVTLREALNAHSDTCVCGCPVADHEFYEEGGEACGHDDHECLRASRAVAAMMVTRTSALEQLTGPCALGTLVYGGADRCGSCPSCIATAALGRDAGKTWYRRPSFAALAASAPAKEK
jgi:hypothetical protein